MLIPWSAIAATGLAGFAGGRRWARQSDRTLVLDPASGTLTLVAASGEVVVAYDRFDRIQTEHETEADGSGEYVTVLHYHGRDGHPRHHELATWRRLQSSDAYARWLRQRVGLDPDPGDSSTVVALDFGAQLRAFMVPNVAISASLGFTLLTGDADFVGITGDLLGSLGIHYFFF